MVGRAKNPGAGENCLPRGKARREGKEKNNQERKKEEKLIESTDNSRPASAVNDQNL